MDLATLLNTPVPFHFEGATYHLRQPTIDEAGEYQRQLEAEARASAGRAAELPEEDRRNLLRDVNKDIAAGEYSWNSEVCVKSLRTPEGVARLLAIVCKDQGVTYKLARKIVEKNLEEIAALLLAANAGADPEAKKLLGSYLKIRGLPENFLDSSSSDSATPPTAAPPTSTPSEG